MGVSVKEDGGTVGVFSPKGVSQVIFILYSAVHNTCCQSKFAVSKGAVTFTGVHHILPDKIQSFQ